MIAPVRKPYRKALPSHFCPHLVPLHRWRPRGDWPFVTNLGAMRLKQSAYRYMLGQFLLKPYAPYPDPTHEIVVHTDMAGNCEAGGGEGEKEEEDGEYIKHRFYHPDVPPFEDTPAPLQHQLIHLVVYIT